jgi:hypothetical protein
VPDDVRPTDVRQQADYTRVVVDLLFRMFVPLLRNAAAAAAATKSCFIQRAASRYMGDRNSITTIELKAGAFFQRNWKVRDDCMRCFFQLNATYQTAVTPETSSIKKPEGSELTDCEN